MARRFLCVLVNKFPCLRDRLIGSGSVIVQVAILIALAIALGVIFKSEITQFVNDVFSKLKA